MQVDVLAVGAHPDDADLGAGGTLLLLARAGFRTGILDLTRGELGTRGTVEERAAEAASAGRLLGLAVRENAGLPDGGIQNDDAQRRVLVSCLRRLRPRILLAPMAPDRHPDHAAAHAVARDANFMAGLARVDDGQAPHRAGHVYYYNAYQEIDRAPAFVVDVSGVYAAKQDALRAYASQLYTPGRGGPETYVSSPAFLEWLDTRARYWGARIGAAYGEPFHADGPIGVTLVPGLVPPHQESRA